MKNIYRKEFLISSYHLNPRGEARLTTLASLFQEMAYHHASQLGFGYRDLRQKRTMWVLSRMKIRVHRYPVWDEMVSVETWHRGMERIFGMRDFRIRDAAGEALAVASSAWLIVDMESRRPVRPDDSILQDNRGEESVFGTQLGKIELPDEPELLTSHPVVYSDLDIVGHVNNVKFIEWCIDAAVPASYNGAGIREFEINYLHEALPGDQVEIHGTEEDNGDSYFVALKNGAKLEIFRARIAWG